MNAPFDHLPDRSPFPTFKLHRAALQQHFGNPDALPFWVADMDFPAPPAVIDALQRRAAHGVYGYEYKPDSHLPAVIEWFQTRHGWHIDPAHVVSSPTILNAVAVLIEQHTHPGDGVIVQPPVFFEFRTVIRANQRKYIKNALLYDNGRYQLDLDDLAHKTSDPNNKVLILCNPHNPVGRVWTRPELEQIADICLRHNVLIISDEIHCDVVYTPHRFTSITAISAAAAQQSVACLSAAKTFNIAGMVDAMVIIPDEGRRQQFDNFSHRFQTNKTHLFAATAIEAAYRDGGPWLDALMVYLQGNVDFVRDYLAANIPSVKLVEPDGTYLMWLDLRALGLDAKVQHRFLAETAGLALNAGHWFGREGAGFARMNVATSRAVLEQALRQLQAAVATLAT